MKEYTCPECGRKEIIHLSQHQRKMCLYCRNEFDRARRKKNNKKFKNEEP